MTAPTPPIPELPQTRRRLRRTVGYVIIALALGTLFIPIAAGFGFVVAGLILGNLNVGMSHPLVILSAAALGALTSGAGLFEGARNSFAKKPIAPRSVAIAVAIPPALVAVGSMTSNIVASFVLFLCAAAGAYGMYKGAQRGARNASMSVGIGDLCAHCGYDLSATPAHQICPECGGTFRFDRSKIG